jgi:hypothetical protein
MSMFAIGSVQETSSSSPGVIPRSARRVRSAGMGHLTFRASTLVTLVIARKSVEAGAESLTN